MRFVNYIPIEWNENEKINLNLNYFTGHTINKRHDICQIGKQGPRHSPEEILKHMSKSLELTTTQQEKIEQILAEQKSNKDSNSLSRKEKHEAMKQSISAVLTSEQQAKLAEIEAKRKSEGPKK